MYIVALCCRKDRPIEPPPRSLIEILDDAARRRPDAPALVGTRERLSYGELLRRVRRVAERIASGAPDARAVAVMASQTPTGIAAALGCAASGRVCIPLNPADPVARRAVILEGASPDAIVVESEAALAGLTLAPGARILMLDDGDAAADAVFPPIDPDAPAFVHYTSGSSGRPKGVVVSWRSAMRRAAVDGLELAASDALLAASGPSISSGMAFVLAGLSVGARLLVVSLAAEGAGAFLRLAQRGSASTFAGSPAILASLSRLPDSRDAFARVRWVRTGSMALPTADLAVIRAMLPPGCNICHTYASTEAMILAMWTIPPDYRCDESALPVGPLADDVAWRLVDSAGRDAPHGEIGELVVSGRFIALGEWERGRLVPGRMPPDPERPGWRVFRTGDLMRIGVDGMLRFSSRVDRQINIHGVRIEPAEIEGVLRAEAGVTDAVALATPIEARVSLDAFVAAPGLDADALREALRARMRKALPTTMRPSRLWVMEALPRLPGGKIDIGALRRLAADGQRNG